MTNKVLTAMNGLLRRSALLTMFATVLMAVVAAPAGALAPQPIDATEQGPLAFVAMTVMVVIFAFTLFFMDRIRKRNLERDEQRQG